ncbi:unnamed protein product, partial [Musa acuminata var. zebrina]
RSLRLPAAGVGGQVHGGRPAGMEPQRQLHGVGGEAQAVPCRRLARWVGCLFFLLVFWIWLLFVVEIDAGRCDVFAVFYYQSGMADVVQVDEAGYNKCDASNPISNYSKGRNYAFQLNHTGRYYFVCSRGYCYGGMRLAILAERLPPPSPPPSSHRNSAARCRLSSALLALAVSLLSAAALFHFHL